MSFRVHEYQGDVREKACYFTGTAPSNIAIVGSPAPTLVTATNRWEITGSVWKQVTARGARLDALTNRCYICPEVRVIGTLAGGFEGDVVHLGSVIKVGGYDYRWGLEFSVVYASATTYYVRLREWQVSYFPPSESVLNTWTGTTAISAGGTPTDWALRITQEGTTVKFWIDSTLELTITGYTGPDLDRQWIEGAGFSGTNKLYLTAGSFSGSYDGADFPDHENVRPVLGIPNANLGGANNNEFGGKLSGGAEDCADTTKGDVANWDNLTTTTGGNGDTDYNCFPGGSAGKELSTLTIPALDGDKGIQHVGGYAEVRVNLSSKNVEMYLRMQDDAGTPNVDSRLLLVINDVWGVYKVGWEYHPDGSPWDRTNILTVDLGAESIVEDANDMWSGIVLDILQVGGIATPTGAPAADRRRGAGQVC